MEKISLSLYNKIANDILLEVKPVKLRKRIIAQLIDLVEEQVENRTKEIFTELVKPEYQHLFSGYEEDGYFEIRTVDLDDIKDIATKYSVEV